MSLSTLKLWFLAVCGVGAASLTIILGPCRCESDESAQHLQSEAEGQAVPDMLSLRFFAKSRVVDEVVAGRLSLLQAAALFGALNRLPPQSVKVPLPDVQVNGGAWHLHLHGQADEEWLCQQVIHWVRRALAEEPDRMEATLVRLETEFEKESGTEPNICLPAPKTLMPIQKLLEQAREDLRRSRVPNRRGEAEGSASELSHREGRSAGEAS